MRARAETHECESRPIVMGRSVQTVSSGKQGALMTEYTQHASMLTVNLIVGVDGGESGGNGRRKRADRQRLFEGAFWRVESVDELSFPLGLRRSGHRSRNVCQICRVHRVHHPP